ncbi:hypothetical protein HQN86_02850 [Pedobacter panaciterrae]|uniref:hypothetical protein n=1 Tax=Pedobacter panaciterrae TaxID=363849 RepID=UPI00155D9C1D|nr:hypothetical protein [Pedobacter panaciterrae]NQX52543.1 hypothetical protein [Pedobacter panaciterrae]
MKLHLTLLVMICLAIASCSKKPAENQPGDDVSLGNDSLVKRLNLKISDKQNLIVKVLVFKDSKGSYVIAGAKDKKYWIGYFDGSGNQLKVKTYTGDPTEIPTASGTKVQVGYNFFIRIKEVNKVIYITRQMRESQINNAADPFIEDFTKIDINSSAITNTYTSVIPGKDEPFTSEMLPWTNSLTEITKSKLDVAGKIVSSVNYIYNQQGTLAGSFPSPRDLKYAEKALSDSEYILVTSDFHFVCKRLADNSVKYDIDLLEKIGEIRSGVINEIKINSSSIEIDYSVVNKDGVSINVRNEIRSTTGEEL